MNCHCHQCGLYWHEIQGIRMIQEELFSNGDRFGVRLAALMVLANSLLKGKKQKMCHKTLFGRKIAAAL